MDVCRVCGGTEFYKDVGYYFCNECQTQHEEKREEIYELRLDTTRITKRKISRQDNSEKYDQGGQWTSWEQYNFVLIGLVEELIELGATPNLKLTVLQLWAFYLGKVETAFTSTKKRLVPKLARRFHKRDNYIIYGKLESRKRKRRKGTSGSSIISSQFSESSSTKNLNKNKRLMINAEYNRFAASQTGSESGATSLVSQSLHSVQSSVSRSTVSVERPKLSKHAKAEAKRVKEMSKKLPISQRLKYQQRHITTKYKTGPYVITPMKLWALLYLALRIHNQNIHLADMLRYGREGHLSYYRLDHLLPPEMPLTESDVKLLTQTNEITHKGMRKTSAEIAKFLFVYELNCPNFIPLIERYCKDLNLPKGILTYAERLIAISPPKMNFNKSEPSIPNYEGRAMAFIIVVLKILLRMDGITEYEISRVAEKINSKARAIDDLNPQLFSFRKWQRYIECRRNILIRKHFPTRFKNDSDAFGDAEVYVRFIKSALSRREEKAEIKNHKNGIPRDLVNTMQQCVSMLEETSTNSEDIEIFPPSLTPQYSYLEQLLEHPMYDLPNLLRCNFNEAKVYYLIKPKKIIKFAATYGIQLEIVNSGLHFLDKLMPQFERPKVPSLAEWNASVTLTSHAKGTKIYNQMEEDSFNYLKERKSQEFELSKMKQSYYDDIQKQSATHDNDQNSEGETSGVYYDLHKSCQEELDFGFEDTTFEGKLLVPSSFYLDRNSKLVPNNGINETEITFYKKYNLHLPHSFTTDERKTGHAKPVIYKSQQKKVPLTEIKSSELENCGISHSAAKNEEVTLGTALNVVKDEFDSLERFFIPCEDYWMYHCVFSHIKSKNFEYFETKLPVSFQWLLSECADVVEMTTEDLYEQVCLVETYFAHVLKPQNVEQHSYDTKDNQNKIRQCNKKW